MPHRLPPPLLRDEPWPNGAGTTTVLAAHPDNDAWRWRISIARVEQAAPFSDYPGVQRQLAALDGRLDLHFAGAAARHLARLQVTRFAGAPAPAATLPDGPTRVFNLMTRAGVDAILIARPLVGDMLLPAAPHWLAHLAAGSATLQQGDQVLQLHAGDTAMSAGGGRLYSHGEVLLVRFDSEVQQAQ
jgi:environmental stress-induced protein Ves